MPRLRPRHRPSRPLVSVALAVLFLLVASACGGRGDGAPSAQPAPLDGEDRAEPIGPAAPGGDGPLPAVDVVDVASGATVSLTEYNTGQRPLLVWFWAPH